VADWHWRIFVGLAALGFWNKQMTRYFQHRVEHPRAADIARSELLIDHADSLGFPVKRTGLTLSSDGTAGQRGDGDRCEEQQIAPSHLAITNATGSCSEQRVIAIRATRGLVAMRKFVKAPARAAPRASRDLRRRRPASCDPSPSRLPPTRCAPA